MLFFQFASLLLLAEPGADLLTMKSHKKWKNNFLAEEYIHTWKWKKNILGENVYIKDKSAFYSSSNFEKFIQALSDSLIV